MSELDLGRLLRLKAMIDASVDSARDPGDTLHAAVEAYERLRAEAAELVRGTELEDELNRVLSVQVIEVQYAEQMGLSLNAEVAVRAGAQGQRAQTHLRQLAGWVQGLIEEQLLERRIVAEAEAKARHRFGFVPQP